MANYDAIARGLQGFGAGVAGRGQEFLTGLDNQRKDAMIKDSYTVMKSLEAGDVGGARGLLMDRLKSIQKLGGDPSDTLSVLTKLDNDDVMGAFNDVSTVVSFAQAQGRLQIPASQQESRTPLYKNMVAAGLQPGSPEFEAAMMASINKKGGQTINIGGDGALTADEKIELAARKKRAEKLAESRGKGVAERETADILTGTTAARAIPTLDRSLALLNEIETGGIDAVALKTKQWLGVESANEAELVNALSLNVIKQLKPVFGSQFTKAEGDWLKAIEAGTSKSTEGNRRLIATGIRLAKARVKRGLKAAVSAKDYRAAEEMQEFLDAGLGAVGTKEDGGKKVLRFNPETGQIE